MQAQAKQGTEWRCNLSACLYILYIIQSFSKQGDLDKRILRKQCVNVQKYTEYLHRTGLQPSQEGNIILFRK